MPWEARRRNGKFQVIKKGTNKVVGTHDSSEDADKHVRALYANYHGPENPSAKKDYSGAIARRRAKKVKSNPSSNPEPKGMGY